jgi:molybdopterin-guanine dinucleotide biosynthesis protein MobB
MKRLKPKAIAVVGTKKSGKTTTTESLIKELTRRGYRVAAIKHVSEPDFTIDTPEKDTWRFAQAGARTIVSAAAKEIATIEKTPLETVPLEAILEKCRGNDVALIEGLRKAVAKKKGIHKIVVAKSMDEAVNALEKYKPIIAFSGPYSTENLNFKIPYADAQTNPEKLVDIVEERLFKRRR